MFEELSKNAWMVALWGLMGFFIVRFLLGKLEPPKANQQEPNKEADFDDRAKEETPLKSQSFTGQWFDVLDVSSAANFDEIKAAYKKKISQYHPDKVSKLGPEFQEIAERKSKEINAAYEFIVRRHTRS